MKNSAELLYEPLENIESTIINAGNDGQVKFNTSVERAQVRAKDSAEVWITQVTDTLDDKAENYAKIKVTFKPGKAFVF